ncbi:hypothetical protein P3T37_006206 [Kitasatospora sp. MAA4]|uniref:DUF6221 family protein n=1 Tax=Kitasatospora sp. MAA4 TaxID=3035093 RepID=UPI002476788B|nr:DUF6221 family protein [Kitasatospora sp. MAA4]MDH6136775.1 hypothetical protein [Kitasatospora sp. MAA4]
MTNSLAAFLAARLHEDEAIATRADGCIEHLLGAVDSSDRHLRRAEVYVEHHCPERALAEVAAKRRIIDSCLRTLADDDRDDRDDRGGHALAEQTLRLLALPYREDTEYEAAWSPGA